MIIAVFWTANINNSLLLNWEVGLVYYIWDVEVASSNLVLPTHLWLSYIRILTAKLKANSNKS